MQSGETIPNMLNIVFSIFGIVSGSPKMVGEVTRSSFTNIVVSS